MRRLMLIAICLASTPVFAEEPPPPADVAPAEGAPVEAAPQAALTTYTLNASKSWLYVVVFNDPSTMMARLGHDHGVKATAFTGTVAWNPDDPSACKISIDVPISGLAPDPAGMRERAGLSPDGAVGDDAKVTITNNLRKKDQLDADSFSTITYRSTSCAAADGGKYAVTGNLTIRGVSKTITLPMTIKGDGATFTASGTFKARHTDFGFKPFSNLAGALKNMDEMTFGIEVVGAP